jgi:hypothetical protein
VLVGAEWIGGTTMRCDFEKLWLYFSKKLDLDGRLEVLKHLDECETCFEALYLLYLDKDAELFVCPRMERERVAS